MKTYLPKLDELQNASKAIRIRPENKTAIKEILGKIDLFMNHKEAAYRQAAWIAFLVYEISSAKVQTYTEIMDWLNGLVEDGYLKHGDERSPIKAWTHYFRIPEIASFSRPEFEETKRAMNSLIAKITQATAQQSQGRAIELKKEADIQPEQVFGENEEGKAFLFVPPQICTKTGQGYFFRKGGFLFVDVKKDGRIYPLEGVGGFEESIAKAAKLGIFIWTTSLGYPWPTGKKKLLDTGFSEEQAESYFVSWNLLKRAKTLLEQTNGHEEEKLKLSYDVSVSEEEFFLEKREGCALVDFEGVWEIWTPDENDISGKRQKKEEICSLFLLVKREREEISIVSCPEHLKSFFSGCMETYKEGQKFLGVPQPLQSVLQAQYGAMQTKNLLCL